MKENIRNNNFLISIASAMTTAADIEIIIGKFNPESRMSPILDTLNGLGVEFIESLKVSSDKWVTIDEIGYLEESSDLYKNAIRELLKAKRVIAVIRKDSYPFLQELVNRDDAMVINIKGYIVS